MEKSEEQKIKEYHIEELTLILLILATDLSQYNSDEITFFSESIEGRIDVLFDLKFLSTVDDELKLDDACIHKFEVLKQLVIHLYSSNWTKTLTEQSETTQKIRALAKEILKNLSIRYVEPIEYSNNHLNINW